MMENANSDPPDREVGNAAIAREETPPLEVTLDWSNLTEQTLLRVAEFLRKSLRDAPPQVASMDASTAVLYKALFQLDRAIDEALRHVDDPMERAEALARAIEHMLRITRQIDRLGHLRMLLVEDNSTLLT